MSCQEINDQRKWDEFLSAAPCAPFWQSWAWGDIKSVGRPLRLVWTEADGRWSAAASFSRQSLPGRASYFYCPRGPYVPDPAKRLDLAIAILRAALARADQEKAIFLRFEPLFPMDKVFARLERPVQAVAPVQPKSTLVTDIARSDADILASAHSKTRYNIRLSEKKYLLFRSGPEASPADFRRLIAATGKRDGFHIHPLPYYEKLIRAGQNGFLRLFMVYDADQPAAGAINSFFGDTITYLHGASNYACRRSMAPYFLHWQIIRAGRTAGFKNYDWHGLDASKWPGVTRFKIGFGGRTVDYPGAFDIILRPRAYRLYQSARVWARRFRAWI
ncbi:hypothetical protein COX69_03660 [Candidatus Falkowbacteria bacterium CG_4_10_14_0_2_um_filter_48_10]|uniref:Methicillin resistance protein n=1 Tax=Candidatus Falkowbacteria bacterium CG23_combo_of_CG06-09_8_20_14_all_49_15 TaxID=1974572 RepID=A0A2G9ZLR2_9BACT|nr:MAG: hypothetical protein COX22_00695 [Candidatus Falkowbacteria bacterium CG23_combo_of_CG06-09_8_20_14_all_49_15]PJA07842.1 MAG: hypothetical protein COX69_03660 [Candidatus Falkowbacteria bacterium CG_4_10_14_0_2_um_filter_48_10]